METPLERVLGSNSKQGLEQQRPLQRAEETQPRFSPRTADWVPTLPPARSCKEGRCPGAWSTSWTGVSPGVYPIKQNNVLEITLEPKSNCYLSHLDT